MLKPIITYVGTINDIQDRRDLKLITDSFEVNFILDYLDYPTPDDVDPMELSGLLVLVADGGFEGCFTYFYKNIQNINSQWVSALLCS